MEAVKRAEGPPGLHQWEEEKLAMKAQIAALQQ
jgi:hypothetical protein